MSLRLFIYYCAICGGWAALVGWALGRPMEQFEPLMKAGVRGLFLGLLVALAAGSPSTAQMVVDRHVIRTPAPVGRLYEIREMAFNRAPTNKIRKVALATGMKSLLADGRLKVLAGTTTAEEIVKVAQVEGVITEQ